MAGGGGWWQQWRVDVVANGAKNNWVEKERDREERKNHKETIFK